MPSLEVVITGIERSSECRDYYARKVLDTADIVRDA
jgi:hypothetical protein